MGINLIESIRGEQIFEYKFPEFLNENNEIGDKANDFEVLQVLGNGSFGNVLKVKSKKNLGIYAMKKVNKNDIKGKYEEKYYENEKIILLKLKSPSVIRCYTIFEDNDYMYFVMEFMNNGDLLSYYAANKKLDSKIPEEKLWDLYFKCISGLLYIHNQGIIHRDIKLDNLFLDDDFNIKIGDFNISAVINEDKAKNFTNDDDQMHRMVSRNSDLGTYGYKAPEFFVDDKKRKYDQKVDVYAMGICFFGLASKDKKYYSKELNEIIDKMTERDAAKRYTSEEAYLKIKKIYLKKYVKNSSVKSALNCFYSFKNFKAFFINDNNKNILLKNKESINNFLINYKIQMGNSVFDSIQSLGEGNEYQINSNLFDLRKNMENYGLNVKYNKEIQIGQFIFNFIKILNSILNEVEYDEEKMKKIKQELAYLSPNYPFENGKEEVMLNKILEVYNKRISSLISMNFRNVIKTKKKCMVCNNERNFFSMTNYIPFNVDILTKNFNVNYLHIKDGFKYLIDDEKSFNEQKGILCEKCKKITVHKESKSFYQTARNLIIILNRGEKCENKAFIDFDEKLVLNKEIERYYEIQYQLIGIIEEDENGHYISFTRDENNLWYYYDDDKKKVIKFEDTKHKETVVALFYYCDNDNMILKYNSLYSQQFIDLSLNGNNNNINLYNPNNMIYQNAINYMNQFNFNYYHYYMSIPNFSGQNWNMNYNNNFQMHN